MATRLPLRSTSVIESLLDKDMIDIVGFILGGERGWMLFCCVEKNR